MDSASKKVMLLGIPVISINVVSISALLCAMFNPLQIRY